MPPDWIEIMLNPEAHGYTVCLHCNGYGSSLKEKALRCSRCGGNGLIKKEDQ
jgi:DnaJ-class molecular chaperone